jgi:hypothetical protein
MASNVSRRTNAPVDPMVRLSIAFSFCKKEWRLVSAIVVAAIIALTISFSLRPASTAPFDNHELKDLGGLPLSPAGQQR